MTQPLGLSGSLHSDLERAAAQPDSGKVGLWAWLFGILDFASYRPIASRQTIISALADREGPYYIVKNPQSHTYYRLSARDHFLWELMDGTRTVKDLVVSYFMEYGSFAFSRVATLVSALRANGFFVDQPVNIYSSLSTELGRRDPRTRLARAWQGFLQTPFAIDGIDGFFGQVYRRGGRLLFTRPAQVLYILLSLVGLVLFGRLFASGKYGVVTAGGSVALGLVLLLVAQFVSIFVHEMAHALTVKHYGGEVRKAGMLLYMGMPAFFVDTTDIWLAPPRARLAVTWAGPYSGLVLASVACIALVVWPEAALGALLFKFAFMSYLLVFVNLNPLLELDGYYLLMDWLGIPMLRRRSMAFITEGLPAKWRSASPPGAGARPAFPALDVASPPCRCDLAEQGGTDFCGIRPPCTAVDRLCALRRAVVLAEPAVGQHQRAIAGHCTRRHPTPGRNRGAD